MSMTHSTAGAKSTEEAPPPRPPSQHSSSGSSGSKHVKCIGRYVLTGSTLGKGNFARVEAAVHTLTRAKVAVKIIETDKIKEDYVRKNLLREAQLMRRLHHPNIIRLYETMKTNNLYCLVTEIADGGELLSYVRNDFKERRLAEATTRPFIRQLVSALHHLHSTGIVHRDLKMENILLDKKKRNIKIVDFGLSNSTKPGSLLQTHCGSPEYAAPELFIPGREYGPEVDVWSLGVNLYAMLVGKLPFRSPRQGTKRRQKLLEQITNGLSEYHEKEMAHISSQARDLIGRLLQPDPRRRVHLHEVMLHPWVTKNGEQPLVPYEEPPVDHATKVSTMELMSAVLEINTTEINDAVKRDRCDWLAAVYNLLIDQPEGRNILQQLMTEDPEEQLVDAAHYQGSMEHFRLSQADSIDVSPEVATVLANKAKAHKGYRRPSLSQPQPEADYPVSTLPTTKKEKRHHQSQEARSIGGPRQLNPVQAPPGFMSRRASIASPYNSPEHQQPYQYSRDPVLSHYYHPQMEKSRRSRGRRLPSTPAEETQHRGPPPEHLSRPHSRADSMPDPLPPPWRHNIAHIDRLAAPPPEQHRTKSPPYNDTRKTQEYREPMAPPIGSFKSSKKKNPNLKPIRARSVSVGGRSLSASIDGLNMRSSPRGNSDPHTRSVMLPPAKVAPSQGKQPALGWTSVNNIQKQSTLPGRVGRDIQALMDRTAPASAYSSIRDIPQELVSGQSEEGSIVSVDIQPELFKPRHTRSSNHVVSGDNYKVDPISGGELRNSRGSRTTSARHHPPPGYLRGELSLSQDHIGTDYIHSNGDMHHYDTEQEKYMAVSKNGMSGIMGKSLKFKASREKSASTTLHPQL